MAGYHPLADLAPRDVVARRIDEAIAASRHAARVRVRTADGRSFTREVLHRRGSPENPVERPDIERKFRSNVDGLLKDGVRTRLIELCASLETLPTVVDINEIMATELASC